jgi:hypothetical protein
MAGLSNAVATQIMSERGQPWPHFDTCVDFAMRAGNPRTDMS